MFKRVSKELLEIAKDPIPGVYVDCDNFDLIHVLLCGPDDTPYENGFFYFKFEMPIEYPLVPPKVTLMTTNSKIRFNPNLYSCGKVCLSILGTWAGPGWTPIMSIRTVILSLLGLVFIDNPIKNEPAYEQIKIDSKKGIDAIRYVRFHTINYACLGFVNRDTTAPLNFVKIARKIFVQKYHNILKTIEIIDKEKDSNEMLGLSVKIEEIHIKKLKSKAEALFDYCNKELEKENQEKRLEKEKKLEKEKELEKEN